MKRNKLNEAVTTADFGPMIPYRPVRTKCDYCQNNASGLIIPSISGFQYIPLDKVNNSEIGFYICGECLSKLTNIIKITREV